MDRYSYQRQFYKQQPMQMQGQKQKAMDPQIRHCYILDKDVHILIEYPDYKNKNVKGPEGEIFCSNILECFHNHIKCRWSGISPHYPDPFRPDTPRWEPLVY